MKARGGAAGIQAGGRKLLSPPFEHYLVLNTWLCVCLTAGQYVKKQKNKQKNVMMMVENENIAIADYIVLYIFPSHAATLLKLPMYIMSPAQFIYCAT